MNRKQGKYLFLATIFTCCLTACSGPEPLPFNDLVNSDFAVRKKARDIVASQLPAREDEVLQAMVQTNEPGVLVTLGEILATTKSPSILLKAQKYLASKNTRHQKVGLFLLDQAGQCFSIPDTIKSRIELLGQSTDDNLRYLAFGCLSKDSRLSSRDIIRKKYFAGNGETRAAILDILSVSKRRFWVPTVLAALSDRDPQVRKAAFYAGRSLAFDETLERLRKLPPDPDPKLRSIIRQFLNSP